MVRARQSTECQSLLALVRAGGDASLGETLIRLAAQAAAAHRERANESSACDAARADDTPLDDQAAPLRRLCEEMRQ